ncbi:mitochondrial translation release factor in rescue-like [Schistocerca gregaria]|uniref:mitochondrial translation release factor in rescue-like n=1 Tax=Schistocerca gregaria TaxID=7010 RepID=UPI00211DFC88|nr:mitochondrial translation release factor in rescue-like [Schistocerca gregaria]XP_049859426.1 mitochondrial translation release factor in rescue-like [Schistocerca gregaria]
MMSVTGIRQIISRSGPIFQSERTSAQLASALTFLRHKHTLDYSRVPTLQEEDLEEVFVRGSGPGGQAVNKTNNCVVLTHKPTGLVVKVHHSRLQSENRKLARDLLVEKLDALVNGEHSLQAQRKCLQLQKQKKEEQRRNKRELLKKLWREREGLNS